MTKQLIRATVYFITVILILTGCAILTKPSKPIDTIGPVQSIDGVNYCSSSQVRYKGERFTMTNAHCCAAMPTKMYDDTYSIIVDGQVSRIVYFSETQDLCLAEPVGDEYLTVSRYDVEIGDDVTMIGYPYGTGPVIETGKLITEDVLVLLFPYFYVIDVISAMSFPGNSGSPILNERGEIVGLLFLGNSEYPFEGGIVPHPLIIKELDKYIESISK